MTLLCGFLVLAPAMATSADGVVRRWVDVLWTSQPPLARSGTPSTFARVYFGVLVGFMVIGLMLLSVGKPLGLLKIATNIMNFALGFSCFHTLVINTTLLPKALRPGWFVRLAWLAAGVFFFSLATITPSRPCGRFLRPEAETPRLAGVCQARYGLRGLYWLERVFLPGFFVELSRWPVV